MRGARLFALCALAALAAASCGKSSATPVAVHVDGLTIVLEGDAPLRGLLVDLEWDSTLTVTGVGAGADATRLNVVAAKIADDKLHARVILTDTRKIHLPRRGTVLHLDATGTGAVRITNATASGDGPSSVPVTVQ